MASFGSDAFSSSAFSASAFDIALLGAGSAWDASSSGITNTNASADDVGHYEICQRTGFKQLPLWHPLSELVIDGYGDYIRKKSADPRHPQDYVRARGNDPSKGPQFAEPTDTFLSDSVGPENL